MNRSNPRGPFLHLFLFLLLFACDFPTGPENRPSRPPETGDGWETASIESVGMLAGPIEALVELIDDTPNHRVHGLVLVRNGKLVFEEYWPGTDLDLETMELVVRDFGRETLHYVASVSKSLTSALVGVAVDQGQIGSVDDLLFSHFPEYLSLRTAQNEEVTLKHLLSFSSGYDWNEHVYGFGDPRDSHNQMFNSQDPVEYLLGRAMAGEPGAAFHYNSGDTNLMGEIVRRESPYLTLVEFAQQHLFTPLEIETFEWRRFPLDPEMTFASGGAFLRPRDMAKLGQLYLDGGVWAGERVVSQEWVEASTQEVIPLVDYGYLTGYGYNWWLGSSAFRERRSEFFMAAGWGGQYVFGYPELDLVVVFTAGGFYEERPLGVSELLENFILEAVM